MTNEKEARLAGGPTAGTNDIPALVPGNIASPTTSTGRDQPGAGTAYGGGPPPAYTEMPPPPPPIYVSGGRWGEGEGTAAVGTPTILGGGILADGLGGGGPGPAGVVAPFPANRYDTMTSYVEDGSAVQTVITTGVILDQPILVRCPFCKATVTSETRPVSGCLTWLCCIALSAVGCVYGCCLLPFCSRRLRDVEHHCPKCKNLIALYKRL